MKKVLVSCEASSWKFYEASGPANYGDEGICDVVAIRS